MGGPSVAVGASVLAAAVGIERCLKGKVRAGVLGDDGGRMIDQELSFHRRRCLTIVVVDVKRGESLREIHPGTTPARTAGRIGHRAMIVDVTCGISTPRNFFEES